MTTQTTAYPPVNLGSSANDGTGDNPRGGGQKLNANMLMLGRRSAYPYAAPSIVADGDSKYFEPIWAMQWCAMLRNLDVKVGSPVAQLGIVASNTGSSSTINLTSPARLATMQTALAALNAAGTVYDYVLKIGTNDVLAAITPSQTLANIRKVHEQYLRPNGCRYFWLIAVDPRTAAGTNAQVASINQLYRRYAAENPQDVIFIDTTPYLLDPNILNTNGNPIPYTFTSGSNGPVGTVTDDGLHMSQYGIFAQWPAFDATMQRVYRARFPRNMSIASAVASATLSPFSNQVGANGRTVSLGGTNSLVNSGSGTITGTPPLGFTLTGTLTGTMSLAMTQANVVQAAGDNNLGPGTWPGVDFAVSGTPASDVILTLAVTGGVSPTGGAVAIGDVVGCAFVAKFNALVGLNRIAMYSNYLNGLGTDAVIGTASPSGSASPLGRGIGTIDGIMSGETDGHTATSTSSGYFTTLTFTFPANVPISGSITLLDIFYGKFGPIPASA